MKNTIIILAACLIASSISAQSINRTLNISFNKTTSLVFEEAVISLDRGSKDVLAKKVEGTANAIHVKAGKKGFEETNLTVLTSDGEFHHFTVHYSDVPEQFFYRIHRDQSETVGDVALDETVNHHLMKRLAQKALLLERTSKVSGKKKQDDSCCEKHLRARWPYAHPCTNRESLFNSIRHSVASLFHPGHKDRKENRCTGSRASAALLL
jgi:hypothetical protein